jgi:CBS domain-containing protein
MAQSSQRSTSRDSTSVSSIPKRKIISFQPEDTLGKLNLADYSLKELLPHSLQSSPCVSIEKQDKVWTGTAILGHFLESFTDSLVVTNGTIPVGIVGGRDIIEGVLKNPSSDFFDNKTIEEIMNTNLIQISEETTLAELLDKWKNTKRAFSIIPNQYGGFSMVSARRILEIGTICKTEMRISDLPKKRVATFKNDDTVKDIINSMLENGTRKLILENSTKFITDRIIIEKIARDLNYLREVDNFLELPASTFSLAETKVLTENFPVQKVYDIMFGMTHPYLIYQEQVISPWDLCINLLSDKLSL